MTIRKPIAIFTAILFIAAAPVQRARAQLPQVTAGRVVAWLGEKLFEAFLGAIADKVLSTGEIEELQRQMAAFEIQLRSAAAESAEHRTRYYELAGEIADMRKKFSGDIETVRAEMLQLTSQKRLEGIVKVELAKLEDRTVKLEKDQQVIRNYIQEIDDRIKILPVIPPEPAPLISDTTTGALPAVHPLVKDWALLLTESETARLHLARLRHTLTDAAPEVIAARQKADAVIPRIRILFDAANAELGKESTARAELLKTRKPNHPEVRAFDRRIASLLWLCGISRPIANGPEAGRLGIPGDLLGSRCSQILIAFEASGVKPDSVVPLFHALLQQPIAGRPAAGDDSRLSPELAKLAEEFTALRERARGLVEKSIFTQADLAKALGTYSEIHAEVVALRRTRSTTLGETARLHTELSAFLHRALTAYIFEVGRTLPTARVMLDFRASTLQHANRLFTLTHGAEPGSDIRDEAWTRMSDGTKSYDFGRIGHTREPDIGGVKLTLCYIPATTDPAVAKLFPQGTFLMGSPKGEKDRSDNEGPVPVGITQGSWMAQTEVTQAQWKAVMKTTPSHFKGDESELPVEQVSHKDAMDFIEALNLRHPLPAGWKWMLPTEAQWEYACRAGTTGEYAGDLDAMAWHGSNSGGKTHAVKTKRANAWGLYDMHGNVWEWCYDGYEAILPGGPNPKVEPKEIGADRVFRGGSWNYNGQFCRSAGRGGYAPGLRFSLLGFRPAAGPSSQGK